MSLRLGPTYPVCDAGLDDDDLRERGHPCVCGHDPDRHVEDHPLPKPCGHVDGTCPCGDATFDGCIECYDAARSPLTADDSVCPGYLPDRERLCQTCGGDGEAAGAWPFVCGDCDGRGWTS